MLSTKKLFSNVFINKSFTAMKKNYRVQKPNQVTNNLTFHRQTLNYFRNQPRYNRFVLKPTAIADTEKLDYDCTSSKAMATDELLVKFSYPSVKPSHIEIDAELEKRVSVMSINQMLALMDACLSEKNQLSKNSRSFKKCMKIMDRYWFRRPDLTASQTIQLIYYVSVYKNVSKHVVEYGLQKLMHDIDYLKQLNDEELSILAVATYKSNAKVNDKMLRVFAVRMETNVDNLIQHPLYFVSLIKPLKKAKYHDPILLSQLIAALNTDNNNKVLNDMTSSIHFLTYLADANCSNIEFLQKLVDSIGNTMVKDELKHYRIKDVSNYVFSASYAGLSPKNPDVCKIIIKFLDQIFNTEEICKKQSKVLISMCLSMWMLNYKPIKLMQFLFSHVPVATLRMPNAHKQDNRLNLLLTCALIEQPDFIMRHQLVDETSNSMPDPNKHLCERPFLVKVFETLQKLSHKLCILSIEYNFNIPNLRILGIKVTKNNSKIVHVEVLDSCTCLYDTEIPNGMMKLKFRLESKLNYTFITVSHKENVLNNQTLLECNLETLLSKV